MSSIMRKSIFVVGRNLLLGACNRPLVTIQQVGGNWSSVALAAHFTLALLELTATYLAVESCYMTSRCFMPMYFLRPIGFWQHDAAEHTLASVQNFRPEKLISPSF